MKKILLMNLPNPNKEVMGCWYNGYQVHKGDCDKSVNYATIYSTEHNIMPDQEIIKKDHKNLIEQLKKAEYEVELIDFPEEFNQINNLHHDVIFIRDSGLIYKDYWIKASFSVKERIKEANFIADIIKEKYNKKIITPSKDCRIEFGEVYYIETKDSSYYFGGLSRANKKGHDFVRDFIKPDNYLLIDSEGFHLDTVFCPVVNKDNRLCAVLVTKEIVSKESYENIKKLGVEVINIDRVDSSGFPNDLGNYAVNGIVSPGYLINAHKFLTKGVEKRLSELGIKRFIAPLTYFRYAGGSCHCLSNEFI